MEKRDTLEGDTVKREKWAAGLGSGGLGAERGGGESDSSEDVASGCSGKSSSHSYPTPERSGKPKHNRYLVTEQSDILRSPADCTILSSRTSLYSQVTKNLTVQWRPKSSILDPEGQQTLTHILSLVSTLFLIL